MNSTLILAAPVVGLTFDAQFGSKDAVDVTRSMKHTNDFNSFVGRPVEDSVRLEPRRYGKDTQVGQGWMDIPIGCADPRHAVQSMEGVFNVVPKPACGRRATLANVIVDDIDEILSRRPMANNHELACSRSKRS